MNRRKKALQAGNLPGGTEIARRSIESDVGRVMMTWLLTKVAATRKSYQHDLRPFVNYMGETTIEKAFAKLLSMPTIDAIGQCIAYQGVVHGNLRSAENPGGFAPSTVNRRLTAVRSMLAALRAATLTTIDPEIVGVESRAYRDTRGIDLEAFRKVVANLEAQAGGTPPGGGDEPTTLVAARDLAIFRLLGMTALRRGEVVSLDMEHVDRAEHRLAILQKMRKERYWLKIGTVPWGAIERWLEFRGDGPGPLFQSLHHGHTGERLELGSLNWIIKKRGKEVGVDNLRCHALRHFAITNLLAQGKPIHQVAAFARHSKVETTMIYDDNRGKNVSDLQDQVGQDEED